MLTTVSYGEADGPASGCPDCRMLQIDFPHLPSLTSPCLQAIGVTFTIVMGFAAATRMATLYMEATEECGIGFKGCMDTFQLGEWALAGCLQDVDSS